MPHVIIRIDLIIARLRPEPYGGTALRSFRTFGARRRRAVLPMNCVCLTATHTVSNQPVSRKSVQWPPA